MIKLIKFRPKGCIVSESGVVTVVAEYRLISKKGEGTFSEVLKAQSTKTNKYVAIKCMKAHFYNIDQVTFNPKLFFANTVACLGEQFKGDSSVKETFTAPQHNHSP